MSQDTKRPAQKHFANEPRGKILDDATTVRGKVLQLLRQEQEVAKSTFQDENHAFMNE